MATGRLPVSRQLSTSSVATQNVPHAFLNRTGTGVDCHKAQHKSVKPVLL